MHRMENLIERTLLASRWILVVFNMGLAIALGIYAISFGYKLFKVMVNTFTYDESDMILAMLGLIDATLVASLIVMVMLSSYENFVSRLDGADGEISFLGKLDSGSLKIKVASSIVAISSIHLLQVFLNADSYTDSKIMWLTIVHMAFVFSALILGFLEKIMSKLKV
nr:TIGR00645 family protein [Chthonobacter albigriseus]